MSTRALVAATLVPSVLATNRDRAAAFGGAWNRHVSPASPSSSATRARRRSTELQRGEDPLAVTTQMRTPWR